MIRSIFFLLLSSLLVSLVAAGTNAEGLAFLAKKETEEGVVKLPSGLLYVKPLYHHYLVCVWVHILVLEYHSYTFILLLSSYSIRLSYSLVLFYFLGLLLLLPTTAMLIFNLTVVIMKKTKTKYTGTRKSHPVRANLPVSVTSASVTMPDLWSMEPNLIPVTNVDNHCHCLRIKSSRVGPKLCSWWRKVPSGNCTFPRNWDTVIEVRHRNNDVFPFFDYDDYYYY